MYIANRNTALASILVGLAFATTSTVATAGLYDSFFFGAFGGWAYQESDGVDYLGATKEGSYDNVSGGITFGAYPVDRLKVQGQFFVHSGGDGDVVLDWMLAEWNFNRHLKLRVGKIKQPIGYYSETFEVGVARPFFNLPQSVYGPSGILGEAFLGAGITGDLWSMGDWSLKYDLYAGQVELALTEPWEQVEAEEAEEQFEADCAADTETSALACDALIELRSEGGHGGHSDVGATNSFGGQLNLTTPVEGLTLGVSGFMGETDEGDISTIGTKVEYALDWAAIRTEYFHSRRKDHIKWDAVYVEGTYRPFMHLEMGPAFLEGVEIAARYDYLSGTSLGEDIESRYRTHKETSVGLNYWFTPGFVVKLSYQHINGNMYAFDADLAVDGELDKTTNVVSIGADFAF